MGTKYFGRNEILGILGIFIFLILATLYGFVGSALRGRDIQRKLDMGTLVGGLKEYRQKFGNYPDHSADFKIVACKGPSFKVLAACRWGIDSLTSQLEANYPPFIPTLPQDPRYKEGYAYYYKSNGRNILVLGFLEDIADPEYNPKLKALKLPCGIKICNFGRTYQGQILDLNYDLSNNEVLNEKN